MLKRKIIKCSLVAVLAATVVACGDSGGDGDTSNPEDDGSDPGNDNADPGNDNADPTGETGVLPVILDRMGRPGVSTALVADSADKDAYNLEGDPALWAESFEVAITERATIIDSLDGELGNSLLNPTTIASLLVDDRLRIDTSVPECDIYLALEIGLGGCGGRTLERDVINDTLQHLVSQANPVDDLADNDSVFQNDWPFLGEAN